MRTRIAFLSAFLLLFAGQMLLAQVSGVVNDADGFPDAGAEVSVKGKDTSTLTDDNGAFTIDAVVGEDVLVISPSDGGASWEVSVSSANLGEIINSNTVVLTEVVMSRSIFDPTDVIENGVSTINSDDLEAFVPSTSIDRILQGQLAGVNSISQNQAPGATADVNIRGALSLTGGLANPLYVVDGTYMNADDVVSIDPNNIETVKALTDASKLAVYGARGANGVVIIKTKTAKLGESSIEFSSRFGVSRRFGIRTDLMNSRQKLEYENDLAQVANPNTGNLLGLGRARTQEEINRLAGINTNWSDELLKSGYNESYTLAISSGTEKSSNRFSVGYSSEEGIVEGFDGFQRLTASLNNRTKVNDSFNFGYTLSGAYSEIDDPRDRRNVQSPFWSELNNNPYATLFQLDADGNPVLDASGQPVFNISADVNSFGYQVLDEIFNTDQERRNLRLFGNVYGELEIVKNLRARTQLSGNYDRFQSENFLRPSARLNSFIGTNGTKSDVSSDRFDYNWRNELNYRHSFGKLDGSVTVASEYSKDNFYRIELNSRDFPNNFQSTQNLAATIDQDSETSRFEIARIGYLANLDLSWDNKYSLSAYFRRDGSSRAGFNNQYGNFWGGSFTWDVTKENFLKNVSWLPVLRLNTSYGQIGDDSQLALYSNFSSITQGINFGGGAGAAPALRQANPDATWETNEKFNVGMYFEIFKGSRLRGKFDLFRDVRSGFLFDDNLPIESGSFNTFLNAGQTRTQGVEVDLKYDIFRSRNGFNFTVFGNWTYIDYEVQELLQEEFITGFPGGEVIHRVGQEPFSYNLVRFAGVNPGNGDALYFDRDGNITNVFNANDAVLLEDKSPLPSMFGGFGFTAEYKGAYMRTDFNYSIGNYVYNLTALNAYDFAGADNNRFVGAENYWRNPGDTNVLQRPTVNGIEGNTDQFLQDASYLAWRGLTVGYRVNKSVFEGLPIKGLDFFVQVQNLAIWSKFEGNPEIGDGSTEDALAIRVAGAYSAYTYPRVRSYNFGINVKF